MDTYCDTETCDCPTCMPPGSDGAMDDALEAAQAACLRSGIRGGYEVKGRKVSWWSDAGSRSDVTRTALDNAARALRAKGIKADVPPGMLDLWVAA